MECTEVERLILAGEPLAGAPVEAHVASCASCGFLADGGAGVAQALAYAQPPPPDVVDLRILESAVRGKLGEERGAVARTRALSRPARFGLLAGTMGLAILFYYVYLRGEDWDASPVGAAVTIGACGAAALLLGWHVMRPLYLPPQRAWAWRGLMAIGLLVPVACALAPLAPRPLDVEGYPFVASGYTCFSMGMAISLLVFIAARFLDRGRSLRAMALAAVAAGLIGVASLQLGCTANYAWHLLTGHASVPAGMLLGSWLLRKS